MMKQALSDLRSLGKDLLHGAMIVWVVSVMVLQTGIMLDDHRVSTHNRFLASLKFQDIVVYYGIYPRFDEAQAEEQAQKYQVDVEKYFDLVQAGDLPYIAPVLAYGSPAYFTSDFEVLELIVNIIGGVEIEWNDALFCDRNPYDSRTQYTFFREAEPSSFAYTRPRKRKSIDYFGGYPLLAKRNNGYEGNLPVLTYPRVDADCRMESVMRIVMPSGRVLTHEMNSKHVQIRGVL